MAQFYTLAEAARVLGMSEDELKAKAQSREVRAFMDGGTWRFRAPDIDELARRRGMGSDPEVGLSDLDVPEQTGEDFDLSDFQIGLAESAVTPSPVSAPEPEPERDILLDDISIPSNPMSNTSSTIIGMEPAGRRPGDSDVRLIPDDAGGRGGAPAPASASPFSSDIGLVPLSPSGSSLPASPAARGPARPPAGTDQPTMPFGSDIRPVPSSGGAAPSDSDVTLFHEEDSSANAPSRPAGRPGAPLGSSGEVKSTGPGSGSGGDDESDFELSPSDVIGALQPDNGSDFELMALDASDEFDASPPTARKGPGDSDVTGIGPSASGINLARPSDSGINLQGPGSMGLGRGNADADRARKDALSGTALPTKAEKNLFDDTDFEVDAIDTDSDNRTVQLDAASDFDLDEGESGSEVFAIDEEDVDLNAATSLAPAQRSDINADSDAAADWDDESDAGAALRPRVGEGRDDLVDDLPSPAVAPMRLTSSGASNADWGGLWVSLIGVAAIFMILLSAVTMDLALNFRGDRDGTATFGLVKQVAGLFGLSS